MNLNIAFAMSPIDPYSGQLRGSIARFLELFGVDITLPLPQLADLTMSMWKSKGKERWQEAEVTLDTDEKRGKFWLLLAEMGLYHEILPASSITSFKHLLLLGGTLRPQDRKNELAVRLWKMGVRFENIAHLGGTRTLDPIMDDPAFYHTHLQGGLPVDPEWAAMPEWAQMTNPETEATMMYTLWQRSLMPTAMRTVPTLHIGAEATTGFRTHTSDTYTAWLKTDPERGDVLLGSASPHVPFQYWDAVHKLGREGFRIHIAGASAMHGSQDMNYFTGAVARWLRSYVRANDHVVNWQ